MLKRIALTIVGSLLLLGSAVFAADNCKAKCPLKGKCPLPEMKLAEQSLFGDRLEKAEFQKNAWTVDQEGVLFAKNGTEIWTKEKYGSFVCSFEYKVAKDANAGFIIQCQDKKNWIPNAIEIQLHDSYGQKPNYHINGALYGFQAPSKNVEKEAGQWNQMKVVCLGRMICIYLNGELINMMNTSEWTNKEKGPAGTDIEKKFQGHSLASVPPCGYIGIQGLHGKAQAPVWFRNMKIAKIRVEEDVNAWPLLFGEKLENADYDPAIWSVDKDGCLHAKKDTAIWSKEKYKNFMLSFEFNPTKAANSGVVIKCSDKKDWIPNSLEIQIHDSCGLPASFDICGAVYGRCPINYNPCKPAGQWNKMIVTCFNDFIFVELNGELITVMDKSKFKDKIKNPDGTEAKPWLRAHAPAELDNNGFVGFQGLHAKSAVSYRNIRIKTF